MPNLGELRDRWFLNFRTPSSHLPRLLITRHPNTNIRDYTDGNRVTPLIDGQDFMGQWERCLQDLQAQQRRMRYIETDLHRQNCRLYHANWMMDNVCLRGWQTNPTVRELIRDSHRQGMEIYPLLCQNLLGFYPNYQTMLWFLRQRIGNACMDWRYPTKLGSNHQKFSCFVYPPPFGYKSTSLMGSIDLNWYRWDTRQHRFPPHSVGDRNPSRIPTHDVGMMIEGPAVADMEKTFLESCGLYV